LVGGWGRGEIEPAVYDLIQPVQIENAINCYHIEIKRRPNRSASQPHKAAPRIAPTPEESRIIDDCPYVTFHGRQYTPRQNRSEKIVEFEKIAEDSSKKNMILICRELGLPIKVFEHRPRRNAREPTSHPKLSRSGSLNFA